VNVKVGGVTKARHRRLKEIRRSTKLGIGMLGCVAIAGTALGTPMLEPAASPVGAAPVSVSPTLPPPLVAATTSGTLTNGAAVDAKGIPADGAYVGATVGSNTDPHLLEAEIGRQLGIRRTFWRPDQVDKAVSVAKTDLAAGRLPWISFKFPASWAEVAAGHSDAWARDIATKLAVLKGPVWVAFHHEPEGDGDIATWVAAQQRLSPIVREHAPNVAYSIILTGYQQVFGDPEYSLYATWPGDGLVDIIGFDVYNSYGVVKDGVTTNHQTDLTTTYFEKFNLFATRKNVRWGLAETGYTDRAANDDPEWLGRTYDGLVANRGVAFAYYDTTLNSAATWHLRLPAKKASFSSLVRRSPALPRIG
jgi:hypothetical protein